MLCNFLRILLSRQNLSGVVSAPDQDVAIKLSRDLFDMSLSVEIEPSQDLSNLSSSVPQPRQSLSVAIPDQSTNIVTSVAKTNPSIENSTGEKENKVIWKKENNIWKKVIIIEDTDERNLMKEEEA